MSPRFPKDGRLEEYPVYRLLAEIGTERLSGVLTVSGEQDTADFYFDSGSCVFAESHYPRDATRLGQLLLLRGYCRQNQLKTMLESQKSKMLKLGRMARDAGWLTDTELMRVLEDQILLILFPCLTWERGIFFFRSCESIPYDTTLFRPVDLKTIFRAGQKILKNWSWMQERLSDDDMVLTQVPGIEVIPEGVKLDHDKATGNTRVLTRVQEKVYELIDGNRTVREICDSVHLFEWFARIAILDLLDAGLITINAVQQKSRKKARDRKDPGSPSFRSFILQYSQPGKKILVCIAALVVLIFLVSQISFRNILQVKSKTIQIVTKKTSIVTLKKGDAIRSAIIVFYLFEDRFPDTLNDLENSGLLQPESVVDGWGTEFQYNKNDDHYELKSLGPDGINETGDDVVLMGQISDHVFGSYYPQSPVDGKTGLEQ